jgi:hypothetical protein
MIADIGVTKQTHGQSTTMSKKEIVHRDLIGKLISVGDIVAFAESGSQYVGKISKLTAKRVKINRITAHDPNRWYKQTAYQRPPDDVVIIEGAHVTSYILKNSN